MNNILELLKNAKVEWKKIGELLDYEQPNKYIVKSKDYVNKGVPVLTAGQTFMLGFTDEKDCIYYASKQEPVIIFDDFTTNTQWVDFDFKVKSSAMKILKPKDETANLRYCCHYIKTIKFDAYEHKRMWISKYSQIEIPIPPIELQKEIVRILDTFSELIAELQKKLQAELTLRKKQYEYYLNMLLKNATWKKVELGSVCTFIRGPFGGSLKKICFKENGYAVYEQQHAIHGKLDFRYFIDEKKYNELKRFEVNEGDMIVSCSGTIGRVFVIPQEAPKGIINQALLKLSPSKDIEVKYLKYLFENSITKKFNESKRGGAIENVPSIKELKKIEIPLPSIEEQKKIVNILDKFSTIINDLNEGLPAEIKLREQQYEYYREMLLSFPH